MTIDDGAGASVIGFPASERNLPPGALPGGPSASGENRSGSVGAAPSSPSTVERTVDRGAAALMHQLRAHAGAGAELPMLTIGPLRNQSRVSAAEFEEMTQ